MDDFLRALIGFFAIVDPIGNILAFEAIAGRASQRDKVRIALLAVVVSFVLIVVFALAGEHVLDFLGISPASFQIAAGILLVLPAIRLVERGEVFEETPGGSRASLDTA
ncbi:MAG: MarC family protein, partial [Dehalococcoidia bacterium]|nr:MarC family protein [Dehalococcoidia bacterium]